MYHIVETLKPVQTVSKGRIYNVYIYNLPVVEALKIIQSRLIEDELTKLKNETRAELCIMNLPYLKGFCKKKIRGIGDELNHDKVS